MGFLGNGLEKKATSDNSGGCFLEEKEMSKRINKKMIEGAKVFGYLAIMFENLDGFCLRKGGIIELYFKDGKRTNEKIDTLDLFGYEMQEDKLSFYLSCFNYCNLEVLAELKEFIESPLYQVA